MKAIVQDGFGSADVLEFNDVETPVVGEDDVLVQVRAAGCGPDVWHIMTGKPYFARLMPGFHKMNAAVRGSDVAGRVEAVGGNVTDLQPGDEVMGEVEGAFAEFAIGTTSRRWFESRATSASSRRRRFPCRVAPPSRPSAMLPPCSRGRPCSSSGRAAGGHARGADREGVRGLRHRRVQRVEGRSRPLARRRRRDRLHERGLHGREPPLGRHRGWGGTSAAAAPPSHARAEGDFGAELPQFRKHIRDVSVVVLALFYTRGLPSAPVPRRTSAQSDSAATNVTLRTQPVASETGIIAIQKIVNQPFSRRMKTGLACALDQIVPMPFIRADSRSGWRLSISSRSFPDGETLSRPAGAYGS